MDEAKEIKDLKKQIDVLEKRLALYENIGTKGLFFALNKKSNEIQQILNSSDLKNVFNDFETAPKKFDRLKDLFMDAPKFIQSIETLRKDLGITGTEDQETKGKYNFIETIAEKRS